MSSRPAERLPPMIGARSALVRPPLRTPYVCAVLLLIALFAALGWLALQQERERQREAAVQAMANVARVLEANVLDYLGQCDAALRLVGAQWQQSAGEEPMAVLGPRFAQQLALLTDLRQLRIVDAHGTLVWGRETGARAADPQEILKAPGGLMLAGPLRDPQRGDWVLRLSRAMPATEGASAGQVIADLPVRRIGQLFDALQLGRDGAATLRMHNLAMVYRNPWPGDQSDKIGSTAVSAELKAVLSSPAAEGHYMAATALDGIERVNAWRRVHELPLTVIVGQSANDLAIHRARLPWMIGLLAGLGSVVVVVLALLLYRASTRRIGDAEQRFQDIVQYSRDAIICRSLDSRVTSWNPGAEEIFGYAEQEMLGRPITVLLPAERLHEEGEVIERISRGELVPPFETVRRCRDGRLVDVSVSVAPLYDAERRVIGVSSIARDIRPQKAMEAEIRSLAFLDPLTRLPNRRLLLDRLQHALAQARRRQRMGAVVFIDLNHFKQLNDSYGHDAGDRVLAAVGQRLAGLLRASDTAARLGGDEFVMVCTELSASAEAAQEDIRALVPRIEQAIAAPVPWEGGALRITASIGWRLFRGDEDLDRLIKDADVAMYRQKSASRGLAGDTRSGSLFGPLGAPLSPPGPPTAPR